MSIQMGHETYKTLQELFENNQIFTVIFNEISDVFNKNFGLVLFNIDKLNKSNARLEPKEKLQEAMNIVFNDLEPTFNDLCNKTEQNFTNFYSFINIENINDYVYHLTAFCKKERINIVTIHLRNSQMEDLDNHLGIQI